MRDQNVGDHAEAVAGVMIANGQHHRGVAPQASLYASADVASQTVAAVTAQHVALQNDGDVRATNFSFGRPLDAGDRLDGNSLLTQFVDWSASKHDVLYVIAGNQYDDQGNQKLNPLPSDEYNGMTVAMTEKDFFGVYTEVTDRNDPTQDAEGDRRSVDIVAPGEDVRVPYTGNWYGRGDGTSRAAPHVTGAVALLQQYADGRILAGAPGWSANARRHQVMKAVLMNSADKLEDTGNGYLLGMETTILKRDYESTWLDSDARDSADNPGGKSIPLDLEMGTGQLNVSRAVKQFSPGNYLPGLAAIPAVGWSFLQLFGALNNVAKYPIKPLLQGGSYISITLTWDRFVSLQDGNNNGKYDDGETFSADPLTDLNLYLLPKGSTDISDSIWSSVSTADNVEHIFFKLPNLDREYEFWVVQNGTNHVLSYAVAWWAVPKPDEEETASIGDVVWNDANHNGLRDTGEPGIPGVLVDLYKEDGAFLTSAFSGSDGSYAFENVEPGNYYLRFNAPAGYDFTVPDIGDDNLDSDADDGGYTVVFPVGDQPVLNWDAGLVFTGGSVGDFVWDDVDTDGIQDEDEPGLSGVRVYLLDASEQLVAATTTDDSGYYEFSDVALGTYTLRFNALPGYQLTAQDQGGDDDVDSDASPSTGQTASFEVTLDHLFFDFDAGLFNPGGSPGTAISDFVWDDLNHNGIQDAGEPGLANLPVHLLDANNQVIGTTTTDLAGYYVFSGVQPGSYKVQVLAAPGYTYSPQDQGGNDARDSDVNPLSGQTALFTVTSGQYLSTIDVGMYDNLTSPASVSGRVWDDVNGDGIQAPGESGMSGVVVQLLSSAGVFLSETTTDAAGHYQFSLFPGSYQLRFLAPTDYQFSPQDQGMNEDVDSDPNAAGYVAFSVAPAEDRTHVDAGVTSSYDVGGFVWDDLNHNGIQDGGEPGLDRVYVYLLNSSNEVITWRTTDATGHFQFLDLPDGPYRLRFVALSGYQFSPQGEGSDDARDSDADPATGRTILFTVATGQPAQDFDAGMYSDASPPSASVGGRAWLDLDGDGIQDAGESGFEGLVVTLLDQSGNIVATTTTNSDGSFVFASVVPGTYRLGFARPFMYDYTLKDQGGDDSLDSDVDPLTGSTDFFEVLPGQSLFSFGAGYHASSPWIP